MQPPRLLIHPQPPVHLPSSCLGGKCLMVYEVIPCNRKVKSWQLSGIFGSLQTHILTGCQVWHWSIEFLHIVGAGGCLVVIIIHYWQHKPWVWFPSFSIPSYIRVQVFPIKHAQVSSQCVLCLSQCWKCVLTGSPVMDSLLVEELRQKHSRTVQ